MPPKIPTIPPEPPTGSACSRPACSSPSCAARRPAPIVADLVAQGHLARDQMSAAVDEVVEISRRRSDDLRKVVQNEVQRQLGALGLATQGRSRPRSSAG